MGSDLNFKPGSLTSSRHPFIIIYIYAFLYFKSAPSVVFVVYFTTWHSVRLDSTETSGRVKKMEDFYWLSALRPGGNVTH